MSIPDMIPTLNYLGAIDTSSSTSGQTMYVVLLDQSIPGLGNTLMFEYKYIGINDSVEPTNVTLGYVSIENAINTGISNQWSIAIPAPNSIYNPNPAVKVAVRAYVGLTGSSEISVTDWSNELDMYVPPAQQTIYSAYYDANQYAYGNDDLYVFLEANPDINYDEVKFVAAFYYKNASGVTVWDVSEPVFAVQQVYNGSLLRMIHIRDFGVVSDTEQHVYVAVYATFSYNHITDGISKTYYSVSEVSATNDATPVGDYTSPTITSIEYKVYDVNQLQQMIVNWNAPVNSMMPTFTVDFYNLYISTDDVNWNEIATHISAVDLNYTVDVNSYGCGTTLYYRVEAVSTAGELSPPSATTPNSQKKMFRYATAPQNVQVLWSIASADNSTMDIRGEFKNPISTGCGTPQNFVVEILSTNGTSIASQYIPYDVNTLTYTVNFNDINYSPTGNMQVILQTTDTNTPNTMDGVSAIALYTSDRLPIFRNVVMSAARDLFSFDILTNTSLVPEVLALYNVVTTQTSKQWFTTEVTQTGVNVVKTVLNNGEIKYSVTMTPIFIDEQSVTFPDHYGVVVSNPVGVVFLESVAQA